MKTLITLISLISLASAHDFTHWEYFGENGPSEWVKDFPSCGGESQSPIDVDPFFSKVEDFEIFYFSFYTHPPNTSTLINNGHSLEVKMDLEETPEISGGNLTGNYSFAQYHIHWGADNRKGSEHTINQVRFPMEMHMVHFKTEYGSVEDALTHPDGLAVLGFLFVASSEDNPALEPFIYHIEETKFGVEVNVTDLYPLSSLFPADMSRFYRYNGSLTTPPCTEAVVWTLFDDNIPVSDKQLDRIRSVVDSSGDPLVNNFRETQDLNDREVYRSFMV